MSGESEARCLPARQTLPKLCRGGLRHNEVQHNMCTTGWDYCGTFESKTRITQFQVEMSQPGITSC